MSWKPDARRGLISAFLLLVLCAVAYVIAYGKFVHHDEAPWSSEVSDDVHFELHGPAITVLAEHPVLVITPLFLGAVFLGFLVVRKAD